MIASLSPEGSGSAAEAWSRGKCTRQVLADTTACGCCQPCHTLRRGPADPAEQPEHGRSHRPNCPAPRSSEWVPGGELLAFVIETFLNKEECFFYDLIYLSFRWWSCCWTKGPTWVPSTRRKDSLSIVLLTWVSKFHFFARAAQHTFSLSNSSKCSYCSWQVWLWWRAKTLPSPYVIIWW